MSSEAGCIVLGCSCDQSPIFVQETFAADGSTPHAAPYPDADNQFLSAIRNGDLGVAYDAHFSISNMGIVDENGDSAMMLAAKHGRAGVVRLLLAMKMKNVDETDDEGWTPVQYAAQAGHAATLTALAHADPDLELEQATADGDTALDLAARNGHLAAVRVLLALGAQPCSPGGDSPALRAAQVSLHTAGSAPGADPEVVGRFAAVVRSLELTVACEKNPDPDPGGVFAAIAAGQVKAAWAAIKRDGALEIRDTEEYTPLVAAAKHDLTALVRHLVEAGANVNAVARTGHTALLYAAHAGNVAAVRTLVAKGASVDAAPVGLMTPLFAAARRGHSTIVRELLSAGANVDARQDNGWTALTVAASKGHQDIVTQLIMNAADVDPRAEDGSTPLMHAAYAGHQAVVTQLLRAEADPTLRCRIELTAAMLAHKRGHEALARRLQRFEDGEEDDDDNEGEGSGEEEEEEPEDMESYVEEEDRLWAHGIADRMEAPGGMSEMAKIQLGVQAMVEHASLCEACDGGDLETVRALAGRVNLHATSIESPLQIASRCGNAAAVAILLANGARPDFAAKTRPALLLATEGSHTEVVDVLCSRGANADAADKAGWTALMVAVRQNNIKMARLLLRHRANPSVRQTAGGWTPLLLAAREGHSQLVRVLLEAGADTNAVNAAGGTALMVAALDGRKDVVRQLLRAGADVNLQAAGGATALVMAAVAGHAGVVRALRAAGADTEFLSEENASLVRRAEAAL